MNRELERLVVAVAEEFFDEERRLAVAAMGRDVAIEMERLKAALVSAIEEFEGRYIPRRPDEYVYLIQVPLPNGPVKIGLTHSSDMRRIVEINAHHPWPLIVRGIRRTLNASILEADLHRRFHAKRLQGEWFQLTEEEILDLIHDENFHWERQPPPIKRNPPNRHDFFRGPLQ